MKLKFNGLLISLLISTNLFANYPIKIEHRENPKKAEQIKNILNLNFGIPKNLIGIATNQYPCDFDESSLLKLCVIKNEVNLVQFERESFNSTFNVFSK